MPEIAEVVSPGLHLRAEPNQDSRWFDKLARGDKMTVLARPEGSKWAKVRVHDDASTGGGLVGWVHMDFVLISPSRKPPRIDPPTVPEPEIQNSDLRILLIGLGGIGAVLAAILYWLW